jgi:hypothetical protein
LPLLAEVRAEYNHEVNAELVYELCAALVREGLGTAETWKKSGGNALAFAQHAIMSAINSDRGDILQRNVEYHLEVSDQLGRAGSDAELESGQLVVTVECGGSGYFRIGPALDALEAEAEGLGAAFYWALTFALYRVMWIYNHDNALMYEERMRDYAAEDDAENQGQYEFPEVEKALPECIRKTQKREYLDWKARDRDLLRGFRNSKYSSWFERLRRIQRLSRVPLKQSREFLELGYYDDPPLPSLLFRRRGTVHDGGHRRAGRVRCLFAASAGAGSARYSDRGSLHRIELRVISIDRGNSGELSCRRTCRSGRTIASNCMRLC